MLARVAGSLYWMSRYLERAEATLRLVRALCTSLMDSESALHTAGETLTGLERLLIDWGALDEDAMGENAIDAARDALHDETAFGSATYLVRADIEQGLGELVSRGRVTSDSFAGVRALFEQHLASGEDLGAGLTERELRYFVEQEWAQTAEAALASAAARIDHLKQQFAAAEEAREIADARLLDLGEQVRVKQFSCTVVGVLNAKGQAAMGNDQDTGRAALGVRVVVKLVHDHLAERRVRTIAQRIVGQDLRRAAENGRVPVHRGIPGGQTHIFGPEIPTQGEEFFIHQRLDRAGVNGTLPLRHGLEMQRRGHQRFPGSRGRIQDHVLVIEQFQNRLLLGWIQFQFPLHHVIQKPVQQVRAGSIRGGGQAAEQWVFDHREGDILAGKNDSTPRGSRIHVPFSAAAPSEFLPHRRRPIRQERCRRATRLETMRPRTIPAPTMIQK